ncbi:MAG: apolipoprotein N-acyltransferase [Armatimonadota bacterium]
MLSILMMLISGGLLALSYPYADVYILAWFIPAILIWRISRCTIRMSIVYGLAFGTGFFITLLYWLSIFGMLPLIALAIYQGCFIALFAFIVRLRFQNIGNWQRLIAVPALWVSIEWLRSLGMFGFTWGDMGYSQYKAIPIIQMASVTGIWGISFVIVLFNTALADLITHRSDPERKSVMLRMSSVITLILVLICYGIIRSNDSIPAGKTIKAAIIQGNIDQDAEEDSVFIDRSWSEYSSMSADAGRNGADIIIWPETVAPGSMANDDTRDRVLKIASDAGTDIIAGVWDRDKVGRVFNSAFLVSPNREILGKYHKCRLVPFGEFVPARKYLSFLEYYHVTPYDTSSGCGTGILDTGKIKYGIGICFESIFPHILRNDAKSGSEVLCVITNDCWYDETAAAKQHMAISVLRAVENRRYLLRAAATGISCIIDPYGRIVSQSHVKEKTIIKGDVSPISDLTIYTRFGDWFVYLCLVITLGAFLIKGERK